MKKNTSKIIFIHCLMIFITFLSSAQKVDQNYKNDPLKMKDGEKWIKETVKSLSLEEKIAQLIIPFSYTYYASEDNNSYEEILRQVRENHVGGVIFSLGDPYECAMLANKLQSVSKVPLLISADFERGAAMRIDRTTSFPYNMAIGASGDEKLAFEMGKIIAIEGRALGVHQNYAPVVDLNNNPKNPIINVRAYGENPELVTKLANAFIKGTHEGGMVSTIKHFPGHGDTEVDSHKDLPVLNFDKTRLDNLELIPFKNTIKSGAMSVMVAHLSIPALEPTPNLPGTLSPKIITDLLKNELKFAGLIVTDAMEMRGVGKNFTIAESSVRAIKAGIDMLLMPENTDIAIRAISEAVKKGEISIDRIEESLKKVLAVKYWLGLNNEKYVDIQKLSSKVGIDQHWQVSRKIAEKSITLLKNESYIIPLNDTKKKISCITVIDNSENDYGSTFETTFRRKFSNSEASKIDTRTTDSEFEKIYSKAKSADIILIPIYMKVRSYSGTISINKTQKKYLDSIYALNKPVIMLSFGNPYLIMEFPKTDAYLNAYSDYQVSIDAMLQAIFGEIEINGKSPVEIPGFYKVGAGINIQKTKLKEGSPLDLDMKKNIFSKVDKIVEKAIHDSAFPGASLIIVKDGITIHKKAYGNFEYDLNSKQVTPRTIFDLASVSKVMSTTMCAMKLVDEGKISLDATVVSYLPEFGKNGKEKILVKNLLLHNSGLPAFKMYYKTCKTAAEVIDSIFSSKLEYSPGEKTVYSDFGMITMGKIIEKVTGKTLDNYVSEEFYTPLGMKTTMYNPPPDLIKDCAPTEKDNYWRKKTVQGTVHDENSALLNGVAGHAGLFSTIEDLAKIMQMLINGGTYDGKKYIKAETIKKFTTRQSHTGNRGIGWGMKNLEGYSSCGKLFSNQSFGHTGFTGTCIWADPTRNLFVIFLTNRVYPTRENTKISKVREDLHDEIIESLEKKENKIIY